MNANEIKHTSTDPQVATPKFYALDLWVHPTAAGLSVGHLRCYLPLDTIARHKRMQGYRVLHCTGWDAFGLPVEHESFITGRAPLELVREHATYIRKQMDELSLSYDWDNEIMTADPDYFRWTQWFFCFLADRGLVYRAPHELIWCPGCCRVMSENDVFEDHCRICEATVQSLIKYQWFWAISRYAERLLDGLQELDWPAALLKMQSNWIGQRDAISVTMSVQQIPGMDLEIVFEQPEWLYGIAFVAITPEHPLVTRLAISSKAQTMLSALKERDPKIYWASTGVDVLHPLTGKRIPIFLVTYPKNCHRQEATAGVPAHNTDAHRIANAEGLAYVAIIEAADAQHGSLQLNYTDSDRVINSATWSGLTVATFREVLVLYLEEHGIGRRIKTFALRDWLISRQRFWGPAIPVVYCPACGPVPCELQDLPVVLSGVAQYEPDIDGSATLRASSYPEFSICPKCHARAEREIETMGGWPCAAWHVLRFPDPSYADGPFSPQAVRSWLPVDLCIGGSEYATTYYLHSRFLCHVLADAGLLWFREPLPRIRTHGHLSDEDGLLMARRNQNVISVESALNSVSADALRIYILRIAPLHRSARWNPEALEGVIRAVANARSLSAKLNTLASISDSSSTHELFVRMNQTIEQVTESLDSFHTYNATVAVLDFLTFLGRCHDVDRLVFRDALSHATQLLMPFAPALATKISSEIGASKVLTQWPLVQTASNVMQHDVVVNIDGRNRGVIRMALDIPEEDAITLVRQDMRFRRYLGSMQIASTMYIAGKVLYIATLRTHIV